MNDSEALIFSGSVVFVLSLIGGGVLLIFRKSFLRRQVFIDDFDFPVEIKQQLQTLFPQLDTARVERVIGALRTFFHTQRVAGKYLPPVAVPSLVISNAWQAFTQTSGYEEFCEGALGRVIPFIPVEQVASRTEITALILRAWEFSCAEAKIKKRAPQRLPVSFLIDTECAIENGYHYHFDETQKSISVRPANITNN